MTIGEARRVVRLYNEIRQTVESMLKMEQLSGDAAWRRAALEEAKRAQGLPLEAARDLLYDADDAVFRAKPGVHLVTPLGEISPGARRIRFTPPPE